MRCITTYFNIPVCMRCALDGRDERNILKKLIIFPRFLATERKKAKSYEKETTISMDDLLLVNKITTPRIVYQV